MTERAPTPAASETTLPAPLPADDPFRPFDGAQPCVMLVDDDPVITEVLRLYLEDAGYRRFVTTTDSANAVSLAREREPDLLLLDLMMPQVTGFDVLEELRQGPQMRHLPVVVLTSATDADSKLRALELGATDFLAKPVDSSELALRVRNILAVKAYQDRLALCDHVTGLPNRRRFLECLQRVLARGRSNGGSRCAVLQVGLDRFKQINDALGYDTGDLILRRVGARLVDVLARRRGDGHDESAAMVARTGGDEFMVLLPHVSSPGEAEAVAAEIRARVSDPMTGVGDSLYLIASVGIAMSPGHGQEVDMLLARAGQALSFAKKRGGDGSEVYSDEIDSWARQRLELERDLRIATASRGLHLAFQPKVAVSSGRMVGAETLVRWNHPVRGPVGPAEFIPLAEETGLILPIGEWVLREACREAATWDALEPLRVAVNVSARQFQQSDLCETVASALEDSGLPPECLTLEVTESMLMSDPEDAARTLEALKALGAKVSVDDFGTGYSSLAYLKRFSVDELKIDRSFVRDIPGNEDDAAIVTAVVAMARSLGLEVVAEGVETAAQLAFLRRVRCVQYQGLLFSRPVPAGEFAELVASRSYATPAPEFCLAN